MDASKFRRQAREFCSSRTSKCKVGQAKTVLKEIGELLNIDKRLITKALSSIRFVPSEIKIDREPYTNE